MALGDEAILDAHTFTLANKKLAPVRAAAQHARRAGLTVDIAHQGQIPPQELAALLHDADRWRHGETERGFSMALNRSGDPADAHVLFVKARNERGELVGLLTFVPWGPGGVSLDVMRRSPEAPHGVTELMVSHLMGSASKLGIRWVSLNFCMFRRVYSEAAEFGASTVTRLNSSFLGLLDRFWQLDRLYRANRQYRPPVGAAVHLLRRPRRTAASRVCRGFGRGLPAQIPAHAPIGRTAADPGRTRGSSRTGGAAGHRTRPERGPSAGGIPHTSIAPGRPCRSTRPSLRPGSRSMLTVAQLLSAPSSGSDTVSVSGRIKSIRDHGGVVFAALTGGGATVQLLLERDHLDQSSYDAFRHLVDHGDVVAAVGTLGVSRRGTPSLLVERWTVLAKALHAIPFGQFTNPEARVRRRSTDLIANPRQADLLRQRSSVVTSLRKTLDELGYTEVETPILQRVHGGASARPFTTHINAYDLDLSLRISARTTCDDPSSTRRSGAPRPCRRRRRAGRN